MSALDYNSNSTAGSITNTMTFTNPTYTANFNVATDAQATFVTAGRYTYTSGTGYGSSAGTYTYVDGSFNPAAIDWNVYYSPSQNATWSYPAMQP